MSSAVAVDTLPDHTLKSIRDDLNGNLFRAIDGFLPNYFGGQYWISGQQEEESAELVKFSTEFLNTDDLTALRSWFAGFRSFISSRDYGCFAIKCEQLSTKSGPFEASILFHHPLYDIRQPITVILGEYHHADQACMTEDHNVALRFCERARRVFNEEPARLFLHGFLVCGTTLELWVFDRSGAYSSEIFDLTHRPETLLHALLSYAEMSDIELGFNIFKRRIELDPYSYVLVNDRPLILLPDVIAAPDYLVGPGTVCHAAVSSRELTSSPGIPQYLTLEDSDTVVKFSWRKTMVHTERELLERAREHGVWGVIEVVGFIDLMTTANLHKGLKLPTQTPDRIFSCIATAPRGRPIQTFTTTSELLYALHDLVRALQSLYENARIIHRDIAIKNLVIVSPKTSNSSRGVLIDLDLALDLNDAPIAQPMVGSDGFMAIGILSGHSHTYRHDLESLFYVFLWLVIANDRKHDNAYAILGSLKKTTRLKDWCSMDFPSVGRKKAADMSPEGFSGLLEEFSHVFVHLRGLATELHELIFPLRDGKIFTGSELDEVSVKRLYDGMADAFNRSAIADEKKRNTSSAPIREQDQS